jgi:hypothetical protein
MDQRHCNVSPCFKIEMSCSVAEKSLAALSVLCPATKTGRSGLVFGDAPPKGHPHLGNPILQNMDQRHCNVSPCFRTERSCSVLAEKGLAAPSVLRPATKTGRSGLVFRDAPPMGHHHLCNPILQNMDQRHCNLSPCFRIEMSVAESPPFSAIFDNMRN